MPAVLGNIIVIAALIVLVVFCIRQIIGDIKGGSCTGCSGGCASCGRSCSSRTADSNISASKAADILDKIEKPRSASDIRKQRHG
ncbi:MAG: FeoB-associated Cys-rich membrane protein [Lachnospiraceae bacterium]|nr:FeoB-associated Cys-rich membrane protein [Lachnospiraceae bacterium]